MKTRALLLILGLAIVSCESPTGVGHVDRNNEPPSTPPQEPERTDTLRLTGTVTLNGIPRAAIVDLGRPQSGSCPFVPYAIGCWPSGTSVIAASTQADAEGRYELSGVLSTSETLSCASYHWLKVTFTDPGLQGLSRTESLGEDVCGDTEVDLAFAHLGIRGVLRIDGEPAPTTYYFGDTPRTLIRYPDGTTQEGWTWVKEDGAFALTLTSHDLDSSSCGRYEGATLQITLRDGRTADPVPLYAGSAHDCAARPFIDVEVDI